MQNRLYNNIIIIENKLNKITVFFTFLFFFSKYVFKIETILSTKKYKVVWREINPSVIGIHSAEGGWHRSIYTPIF